MSETRTVVLVEGASDKAAFEALARRHERDLTAEGISLVAMGGATNIGTYVGRFGPAGLGLRLAGLCDAGEEDDYRRSLERAGLGSGLDRDGLEALGFFTCVADLEDELIRALGTDAVEAVIEAEGELGSFRTLQRQPAWREGSTHDQLRRFMGAGSGRKIRYSGLLVAALELDRVPRPLDLLLAHVLSDRPSPLAG
ncbi:TOPRIM nucleotidyl transferase/hydrolase domain-containing protein [Nonomuraea sp. LP-02]|uniref:TOPRIM nucleotidyl transferase/hydrolase domain-containing protein n=1 Tax=Nonomuraea sp. LP-02 TaxID=3097960 RepID=UPI002E2F986C|nr:TOPRIM nucleotidyl transferase/hydrolase domain-containing protein [Nonomuraea sp. LP-02]MED7923065.1 TOPRIM nucleotidyl transferase/hydrolase domain-containing protein [Nonomuraea sp. LP-02]